MSEKLESIAEEVRKDLHLAYKQKEMMQKLISSEEYQYMKGVLEKQVDYRIRELLVMPQSEGDVVRKTYSSGEIAGIKLALDFPEALLEGATETINMMKRNEEEFEYGKEE
jgi:hypothetical protein